MPNQRTLRSALSVLGDLPAVMAVLVLLIVISRSNYLLFHSLVEAGIAAASFNAFAFAWNSRRFEHGYLLLIGIAYFFNGLLGFLHALAYQGMGVFPDFNGANLAPQLWIASRYLIALTLVVAPFYFRRRLPAAPAFLILTVITTGLLAAIFTGNFPTCYVIGSGLTPFKIISEYVICGMLLLAFALLYRHRDLFPRHARWFLAGYFIFGIATELVFTTYLGMFDWANRIGHVFLLISTYAFYKAIVETGIRRPFDVLFRELTQAVRTRDEFLSVASHELKTPLTPLKLQIQSFQRLLRSNRLDTISPEQANKMIDVSTRQINRLTHLIESLLDVSRITSGKLQLNPETVDVPALFEEILQRHAEEIKNAHNETGLNLPLEPISIRADHIRLDQVITNLLTNALKYAPGSKIELGIRMEPDGSALLWVEDNGPGVPKQFQMKIFERFERALPGTHISGLGLGLFISRQIVDAHGGTLRLVNGDGPGGSRFEVRLPILPAPVPVIEKIKSPELDSSQD